MDKQSIQQLLRKQQTSNTYNIDESQIMLNTSRQEKIHI